MIRDFPPPRKSTGDPPKNGEVKIIVPADPDRLKAYKGTKDGKVYTTKQFNPYSGEWNGYKKKEDK